MKSNSDVGQLDLLTGSELAAARENVLRNRSGSFVDNMKLPIHRWFRYSAGFSGDWAKQLIASKCEKIEDLTVLDPFSGSGTTLISADMLGVKSYGLEPHSFVNKVASAKLSWNVDPAILVSESNALLDFAKELLKGQCADLESPLLLKCFSETSLKSLCSLRDAFNSFAFSSAELAELIWLAITSIIRKTSSAGTAQWQYVLPKKSKKRIAEPYQAFKDTIQNMAEDMQLAKSLHLASSRASCVLADARSFSGTVVAENSIDLVVTSPPYPNNYDYADATRLEMTFWGYIKGWKDLQGSIRKDLIRSCSQHSAAEKLKLEGLLETECLSPIKDEVSKVCLELEKVRLTKGGKKTYHTMVAAYFVDLARVWGELYKVCREGAEICFVVGDSAPYGVHVPVEKWLGDIALSHGFESWEFEKLRDRNVKWKNRKHTVPLHEGRLWVKK
ncbi:site-specific DNA-methyltransferase [Salinicola salarius]|uniref:site-specific DNA-methyltransferase n=1 Tax=Salinicola salarius TaxID=430457 RepID=UPI00142E4967|nr:site-specific DNA-methyltransferase [Salinicola salarius]